MLSKGDLFDGKYRILERIGQSAPYDNYLAQEEKTGITYCIKLFRRSHQAEEDILIKRHKSEFEMVRKYHHPKLPHVYDIIEQDDIFAVIMDFLEGMTLQELLDLKGPQDPEEVVGWCRQIVDVLDYLSKRPQPVLLLDIRLHDILLKPDGNIVILSDLCIAYDLTKNPHGDRWFLGTKGFAAPEMYVHGRWEIDARSSIFVLGTVMYYLMTGYTPQDTNFVIFPLGDLRPELKDTGFEYVVRKCCQVTKVDRFQDFDELKQALIHIHDYDKKGFSIRKIGRIFGLFF